MWTLEEEAYLIRLSSAAELLATRFKERYGYYRLLQARFQIPAIVVSSGIGLASFGVGQFPRDAQTVINLSMGITGLMLGILNSVQSYLKIGETMAAALLASSQFQKLTEHVALELSMPRESRSKSGLMFVRDAYNQYEKIYEAAPPVMRRIRFIKPHDPTSTPSVQIELEKMHSSGMESV